MDVARSLNGVPIRFTDERWEHIVASHEDLEDYYNDCLETIERPELVMSGNSGSLIAVRGYGRNRYLLVIYREVSADDGYVITAFFAGRINRRKIIWRR